LNVRAAPAVPEFHVDISRTDPGKASSGGSTSGDSSDEDDPFNVVQPMTTSYTAYESSPADLLFSADSLASLTIRQSIDVFAKFPPVLREKTLRLVGWSQKIPPTDNFFLAGNSIPCLKDVRQFLGDQPEKFSQGYRGVVIEADGEMVQLISRCHH
jgi:hypothetical protein